MTSAYTTNNAFSLLLPKLKPDCDVGASDDSGRWDVYPSKAFNDVANSLEYQAPGEHKSVSSVPTMWARPLIMEMALHDPLHPLHEQMVTQWQGMLAAIALAEVRGFGLTVELLELEKLLNEPFANSLYELRPDPRLSLYKESNKHPWQDVYVFKWQGSPVGITSPSTLIVPAEEGDWTGVPWWQSGCLQAPHNYINPNEKALLWRWLENLNGKLSRHGGNQAAINQITGLLNKFQNQLLDAAPAQAFVRSDDPQFFGTVINRGCLVALNWPVKAVEQPSSIKLIPSKEKEKEVTKDLLLLDPAVAEQWNESPQDIWIHDGKTLASLKIDELRDGSTIWDEVIWIEKDNLFLPEFVFVNHVEDALPGALVPDEIRPITLEGERITPLLPLNPILLDYLTPVDLRDRIKLQPINGEEGPSVRVILDLPLAGTGKTQPPTNYRLHKDYLLRQENALAGVPILEVWPNIKCEGWKEYYAFYYDAALADETFQVYFPESVQSSIFQDSEGGNFQIAQLEQFPSVVECKRGAEETLGLILLNQPIATAPKGQWTVGVDFGTSFTNVYVGSRSSVKRLPLESLHLRVTDSPLETRLPVLFEYFLPENFLPADNPLPLSSVLTTQGGNNVDPSADAQAVVDGRMYIPNVVSFDPSAAWIQTDLKWTNFNANQLFIKNLALFISALAVKNQIKEIRWSLSYPSALSRRDISNYSKTWRDVTSWLEERTGLAYRQPAIEDKQYFKTESLAMAQYCADKERNDLMFTTCIDMGGGTSDISIWEKNALLHQCSIQLAGRDLLSQILERKPEFLDKYFSSYGGGLSDQNLRGAAFDAKLDVWLRWHSNSWLREERRSLYEDDEFLGLIQIMAIGFSGLYYYVGELLRVLNEEDKYSRKKITPVYLGGNGSRLLNWIDATGEFSSGSEIDELLGSMLSAGSKFSGKSDNTQVSNLPKDEVACGLVLSTTRLKGLDKRVDDPVICGEFCLLNGEELAWNERLILDDTVDSFEIPRLERLRDFLYEYHTALKELRIESVMPLSGYKRSRNFEDNTDLWEGVDRELENLLTSHNFTGDVRKIRVEPPFILGLKALIQYLSREWARLS